MDVYSTLQGLTFVWNAQKANENRAKHDVSFETAREAFFDPQATYFDASVSEEQRLGLIGLNVSFTLLCVVQVEREGNAIRLISAREATRKEMKSYENGG
jgi:uncharacterized DUF497 family protein